MDEYLSEHVIPVVLHADNIEDIYEYTVVQKYPGIHIIKLPGRTQHSSGKSKCVRQTHQRALKFARDEKTAVKETAESTEKEE